MERFPLVDRDLRFESPERSARAFGKVDYSE